MSSYDLTQFMQINHPIHAGERPLQDAISMEPAGEACGRVSHTYPVCSPGVYAAKVVVVAHGTAVKGEVDVTLQQVGSVHALCDRSV
jgi:hypothetical protein